jgi:hypothetical protein
MTISNNRCGALHSGDQINSIDQKSFVGLSLAEANGILRACTGEFCRIEVTPACLVTTLPTLTDTFNGKHARGIHSCHVIIDR